MSHPNLYIIWRECKLNNSCQHIYVCISLLLFSVYNLHVNFFIVNSKIRTEFSNVVTITCVTPKPLYFFCMRHYVYILSEENINWTIHVNIFMFVFPYYFFLCIIYMFISLLPRVKSGQIFQMASQSHCKDKNMFLSIWFENIWCK